MSVNGECLSFMLLYLPAMSQFHVVISTSQLLKQLRCKHKLYFVELSSEFRVIDNE